MTATNLDNLYEMIDNLRTVHGKLNLSNGTVFLNNFFSNIDECNSKAKENTLKIVKRIKKFQIEYSFSNRRVRI